MPYTNHQIKENKRLFKQGLKQCPHCTEPKTLSEFCKNKTAKDGLNYYCKEHIRKIRIKYTWKQILHAIKQRCNNPNASHYEYYGGKGIKCLITEQEIKFLWFRDKAYEMVKPSIDRENSNKDYTFKNCQFIEMIENCVKEKRKAILQFDLEGNFIREWESQVTAARELRLAQANIHKVLNNQRNQTGSFNWKYK